MAKAKPKEAPASKKKPDPRKIISRRYMGSLSDEEMGAIDKQIDQIEHDARVALRDEPWVTPKTYDKLKVGGKVDGDSVKPKEATKKKG